MDEELNAVANRISLKIDLQSGLIELDAPAENFQEAISQTKALTSSLEFGATTAPRTPIESSSHDHQPPAMQTPPAPHPNLAPRRSRTTSKASAARAGRIGSFEEVKGLLTEEQEIELRKFFAEKQPAEQSHQVLVAIVKGEQLIGRRGLSYNEIYTLMWLGGIKDLPKAVDVVLQRLMQEQMVVREDTGFAAKFVGRNFVEQDLPKNS